ncbi:MAG: hypothetical protein R3A79_04445 [Nannocystaceae bacterium]
MVVDVIPVVDVESEVAESVPVPEGSVVDVVAVSLFEPPVVAVVVGDVVLAVDVAESLSVPDAESSPLQPATRARAKAAQASPEKGRSRQVITWKWWRRPAGRGRGNPPALEEFPPATRAPARISTYVPRDSFDFDRRYQRMKTAKTSALATLFAVFQFVYVFDAE